MTNKQLEQRLTWLEELIQETDAKDLPYLNQTYQRVLKKLVNRDVEMEFQRGKLRPAADSQGTGTASG